MRENEKIYERVLDELKNKAIPPVADDLWNRIEASVEVRPQRQWFWIPATAVAAIMVVTGLRFFEIEETRRYDLANAALNDIVYFSQHEEAFYETRDLL